MSNLSKLVLVSSIGAVLLSACGGGGGDFAQTSPAPTPVTSFALRSSQNSQTTNAKVSNYAVTGTCLGSAHTSSSAPASAIFEGNPAFAVTTTATLTFTNCTPESSAATIVTYTDSNYVSVGSSSAGVSYGKYLIPPISLPTSVKIGDTAVYGTENMYTDSTKQTSMGQRTYSFVIEQDGASTTTAIVNFISRNFNTANQLLLTSQSRTRITVDGVRTPVSIDLQYSTTSTKHLILTAN